MAKEKNKRLWSYECIVGSTAPEAARLHYGLYTWALRLGGAMTWCYQEGGGHIANRMKQQLSKLAAEQSAKDDPWGRRVWAWQLYDPARREQFAWRFEFTYPGPTGPEPTIGWELAREGVDDYRYLDALEQALAAVPKQRADTEAVKKARALLERLRALIQPGVTFGGRPSDEYAFRFDWDYSPGIAPGDYGRYRQEVAAAVGLLVKAADGP